MKNATNIINQSPPKTYFEAYGDRYTFLMTDENREALVAITSRVVELREKSIAGTLTKDRFHMLLTEIVDWFQGTHNKH